MYCLHSFRIFMQRLSKKLTQRKSTTRKLVPLIRLTRYSMRTRCHNRELPMFENLFGKCCLTKMLYKRSRFSKIWSVKLSTFALKIRPYLSPTYLFPRYSTTSPFSKFSRCSTSPSNASHLYCELSFTKLKIILPYIRVVWGKIDSVIWSHH